MARPTSKDSLLALMDSEYQQLDRLLKTLTPDQLTQPGACGVWSVKDMVGHLYAWQQLVLGWYQAGERGETVKTPADDLTWTQIPLLNQRIYERYKDESLDSLWTKLANSHAEVKNTLMTIPEETLVNTKVYPWTKTTTLLSYFVSCTSSHYHWAYTEIRKWLKAQAKPAA